MRKRTKVMALGTVISAFTLQTATLKLDPEKVNSMKRQVIHFGANHLKE